MLQGLVPRTMNASSSFWNRLLPGKTRRDARPRLRVQPLGLSDAQLRVLQLLCERIGESLDLLLEIDTRRGEVVIVDRSWTQNTPADRLARAVDARPLLTCDLAPPADPTASALAVFERRQRELLAQLRELPMVRGRSPQFGASGWDPSVLAASYLPSGFDGAASDNGQELPFTPAQQHLVSWVLRGLMDPAVKPLVAGYGPGALMRIDFAQSYALVDPAAQQALRVRREAPVLRDEGRPGADAIERDLPELVWDLGIALGQRRLLDAPADAWHTPLATAKDPAVQRFTRLPRHLELASLLFRARLSPAELQRRTGQSAAEIRPFLQACLFLGLAWWAPEA
jgi:hypothetical protein